MILSTSLVFTVLALTAHRPVLGCQFHDLEAAAKIDYHQIAAANRHYGSIRRASSPTPRKIAIQNVRVFDGYILRPLSTVVINGNVIGDEEDLDGAEIIDGKNGTLMPGLIENHAHPSNISHLLDLTRYGITTTMVAACYSPQACHSLQNHTGLTDVILGSVPAAAPNSIHGNITAAVLGPNTTQLVRNISQVASWVANQTASNPAFIKLIAEVPGLDQATLSALSLSAQDHNMRTVCHIGSFQALQQAITARVEQIHHSTLDNSTTDAMVAQMLYQDQISVPTLSIMRAIANEGPRASGGYNFSAAVETVSKFHKAGIPILAGTDANLQPGLVATVPFGISLHGELQMLVENVGMQPIEALRAATSRAAHYWDLRDRGVVAKGKRADLVLVDGDPTVNITATRNLRMVWAGGVQYDGPLGTF
jgi:imidazolonepropionase-like amidohydrolase